MRVPRNVITSIACNGSIVPRPICPATSGIVSRISMFKSELFTYKELQVYVYIFFLYTQVYKSERLCTQNFLFYCCFLSLQNLNMFIFIKIQITINVTSLSYVSKGH